MGPFRAVSVTGLDTLVEMFGMEVFSGRGSMLEIFGGDNFNAEIRGGHGMHGLIASEGKFDVVLLLGAGFCWDCKFIS